MLKMNRKQKKFIRSYLDKTNPKTYNHATNSALEAGYSDSRAASQGCELLKLPSIKEEIARYDKEEASKYSNTKQEAIIEARKNYEESKTHTEKKYWYDLWVDLQSWKIQKQEVTNNNYDMTTERNNKVNEALRRNRLSGNNQSVGYSINDISMIEDSDKDMVSSDSEDSSSGVSINSDLMEKITKQ